MRLPNLIVVVASLLSLSCGVFAAGGFSLRLAGRFSVTVSDVKAISLGLDLSKLRVRQEEQVPEELISEEPSPEKPSPEEPTSDDLTPEEAAAGQSTPEEPASDDALPEEPIPEGTYTIVSGDTFSSIATVYGTSSEEIQALNPDAEPTNLQIGQVINIPLQQRRSVNKTSKTQFIYKIQSGDTFYAIAARCNSSPATIQALNPGVDPTTLQIGQVINVPSPVNFVPTQDPSDSPSDEKVQGGGGGGGVGKGYVKYSGPSSGFPDPSRWALYEDLWATNSKLMRLHDSKQEVASIKKAIEKVAEESGVDRRLILAMIMQESSGNVRVPNTTSVDGVINTGLMQAHTGSSFDSEDSAGSIERMVRDGVEGTSKGDGILQCLAHRKGNTYEALREYNSGSLGVNREQLNEDGGGPNKYVQLVANRLMGHVWEGM